MELLTIMSKGSLTALSLSEFFTFYVYYALILYIVLVPFIYLTSRYQRRQFEKKMYQAVKNNEIDDFLKEVIRDHLKDQQASSN